MLVLKVSYRVKAHHIANYERIFSQRLVPLIAAHRLRFRGIWRTVVGDVGEYLELWEFDSYADFERRWSDLINDPELQELFQTTGPMVEHENLALLEPVHSDIGLTAEKGRRSSPCDSKH